MKIIYVKEQPSFTELSDFADKYELTMVITKSKNPSYIFQMAYRAIFDGVEIVDDCLLTTTPGCLLITTPGWGSTPEYAIDDYCTKIQNRRLRLPNGLLITAPIELRHNKRT
jgi:hypothetical protein